MIGARAILVSLLSERRMGSGCGPRVPSEQVYYIVFTKVSGGSFLLYILGAG
jgi:hypothetical protein